MAWSLDWFAAEALAATGSQIRRVAWTDQWLVLQGSVWLLQTATTSNVVTAANFDADEFNARDWTDQPYGEDVCSALPAYNTTPPVYKSWTTAPIFTPPPPPGFPST